MTDLELEALENFRIQKNKARGMVNRAVAKGELVRKPCEDCGSVIRVEAHHKDYSKPLEVQWLCKRHHVEHDIRDRVQMAGEYRYVVTD